MSGGGTRKLPGLRGAGFKFAHSESTLPIRVTVISVTACRKIVVK